ncbi:hypothetical protein FAZ19_11185 [Sphingobacterium alkalisoli]|uniref:DUF6922 domain-containing protein n=1 Tax=Sphingobacterium alkalisoli TaxID=1874115 RepID=A0A4U0H251_9SPHI|nr:hypothetical protein [Sphingobacterium alkalisoli]TJY65683.1 hypothetical protein FAZ19_11185 [Sphingobacterium alkalisoli]GGH18994.1 hypothetical protein GCM10011418_23030 [Sphingobacterium alkalisoli]
MNAIKDISQIFLKYLFWDVDPKNLDIQDDRDFIIPRALIATTAETFVKDIRPLEQLYSKTQIVKELRKTKERISNEVCKLVARRYHVRQFLRYQ